MTSFNRAGRILQAMSRFTEAKDTNYDFKAPKKLGAPIGRYDNPGSDGISVNIFTDGLSWKDGSIDIELSYLELADISLDDGKKSEGLVLKTNDGRNLTLPIRGRCGKFYDSFEMLRFLDRTMKDL